MIKNLFNFTQRPELYQDSTAEFWNDEHISKGMLEAHLAPDWEAATRKHSFVEQSVQWITSILPPDKYPKLLDIGCGPGIYAEKFCQSAYNVTGIDFSQRSINYAISSSKNKKLDIEYLYKNYLELDYENSFDIITLIYCDFAVLSDENRKLLLKKVYRALKPNGRFIFDVFTPKHYDGRPESSSWQYSESGFFSDKPHICLSSFHRFDKYTTYLDQHIIITENTIKNYNLWEHAFTEEELNSVLPESGFSQIELYSDVSGKPYTPDSEIICVVARK